MPEGSWNFVNPWRPTSQATLLIQRRAVIICGSLTVEELLHGSIYLGVDRLAHGNTGALQRILLHAEITSLQEGRALWDGQRCQTTGHRQTLSLRKHNHEQWNWRKCLVQSGTAPLRHISKALRLSAQSWICINLNSFHFSFLCFVQTLGTQNWMCIDKFSWSHHEPAFHTIRNYKRNNRWWWWCNMNKCVGKKEIFGAYLESQFHQYDAAWQRPLEVIGSCSRYCRLQHRRTKIHLDTQ